MWDIAFHWALPSKTPWKGEGEVSCTQPWGVALAQQQGRTVLSHCAPSLPGTPFLPLGQSSPNQAPPCRSNSGRSDSAKCSPLEGTETQGTEPLGSALGVTSRMWELRVTVPSFCPQTSPTPRGFSGTAQKCISQGAFHMLPEAPHALGTATLASWRWSCYLRAAAFFRYLCFNLKSIWK